MNLAYTGKFDLSTETIIKKGTSDGGATIPSDVSINSISLCPDQESSVYPTYYVKGIHTDSVWIKVESGVYNLSGVGGNSTVFCYVKSDSEITMNVHVKGEL